MPSPRRRSVYLVAIATAFLAAACSSSSDSSTPATDKTTTTDTAPELVTAAPPGKVATSEPVPSSGCGITQVRQIDDEKVFLDDSDRYWVITTPPEHDGSTPVPLVLDFHGLAEGTAVHTQMTQLGPYGSANGFAVVFPQGLGGPARWDAGIGANTDIDFVNEMLDQIEATTCVDTSRIYSTGLSNGAFMSSALACVDSDRFAAVAPVAGALFPEGCDPGRPVPILAYHGTADEILLFNGGVGDKLDQVLGDGGGTGEPVENMIPDADLTGSGYPASMQKWADQNGCEPTPTETDLTETVLERTWDCPPGGATEFLIIQGGGHSWPGSEFSANLVDVMGATDMSIDANEVTWEFFQRFALPAI